MKIRNGFVSNSSTSSFIMIGIDARLVNKVNVDQLVDSLYIEKKYANKIYGYILEDWSDEDYLNDNKLSIYEIEDKFKKLS